MSFERMTAVIPLMTLGLAITFDTGYFWGLDINFFTLFSLSEHLVFAMQAVPFVLAIILISFLTLPLFVRLLLLPAESEETIKQSKKRFWLTVGFYAFLILQIVFLYLTGESAFLVAAIFFLALTVAIEFVPRVAWQQFGNYRNYVLAVYMLTSTLLFSFAFGYTEGNGYLNEKGYHPHSVSLKGSGLPISGRIVRSGERGILFIEYKSNVLRFFRLDEVLYIAKE